MINNDSLPNFVGISNSMKWGLECLALNTASSLDPHAIQVLYFETQWESIRPSSLHTSNSAYTSEMKGIGQFRIWLSGSEIIPKVQDSMQKRTPLDMKILKYDNIAGVHTRVMTWSATKCVITRYWFKSQMNADEVNEVHGIEIISNGQIAYEITQSKNGDVQGKISTSVWNVLGGLL